MISESLDREFHQVIQDNKSGSVKVLDRLIETLINCFTSHFELVELKPFCEKRLKMIAKTLKDLVIIRTFTRELLNQLNKLSDKDEMVEWLISYRHQWKSASDSIAHHLMSKVNLDGKRILVHSNSQTVIDVLTFCQDSGLKFSIWQTESRPAMEGRIQARELASEGIEVTVITDMTISIIMSQTDLILLGADQFNDHYFLNKTGSYSICLVANHQDIPVYVLTDSRKEMQEILQPTERPVEEVWEDAPDDIKMSNLYFEKTPRSMINRIFTERGSL